MALCNSSLKESDISESTCMHMVQRCIWVPNTHTHKIKKEKSGGGGEFSVGVYQKKEFHWVNWFHSWRKATPEFLWFMKNIKTLAALPEQPTWQLTTICESSSRGPSTHDKTLMHTKNKEKYKYPKGTQENSKSEWNQDQGTSPKYFKSLPFSTDCFSKWLFSKC